MTSNRYDARKRLNLKLAAASCVVSLAFILLICGCTSEKAGGTKVAAFKAEVKEDLQKLSAALSDSVAMGDPDAVQVALKGACRQIAVEFPKSKACTVGVLGKQGKTVAGLPESGKGLISSDYSGYDGVAEVLAKGKIRQMRLYEYNGPVMYVVMAPVRKDGKIVGAVGIAFYKDELNNVRGITEQEFMSMKFD